MFFKRLLFLTAWMLFWFLPSYAQSVEIRTLLTLNNGEEQLYVLSENDQLAFEGQEALVITTQGITHRVSIDEIRKIEFVDLTGTNEAQTDGPFFYPNPVEKYVAIGNLEAPQNVRVYSLDGRLLFEKQVSANEPIDLGNLPAGLYILNILDKNLKLLKQ